MGSTGTVIDINGLRVKRGKTQVLSGLRLSVPAGAIVGLLGPSGCGKTSLMRSIVGSQKIASGDVRVLGETAGSPGLRHRVGYMTQQASIYDDLTVSQNLRYFARVLSAGAADVTRVLELTRLADKSGRMVGSLSGGESSRVSLAVALLGKPELLVLDEPTVGLDPVLRVELWALFRRLADTGTTLLVSSHVMDEATRCDRLLLMRAGQIIADDSPAGLLASTRTATAEAAFLAIIAREEGSKPSPTGQSPDPPQTPPRHRLIEGDRP